jgi:hypothetical protein
LYATRQWAKKFCDLLRHPFYLLPLPFPSGLLFVGRSVPPVALPPLTAPERVPAPLPLLPLRSLSDEASVLPPLFSVSRLDILTASCYSNSSQHFDATAVPEIERPAFGPVFQYLISWRL